jgi:hypothetical protein
VQAFEIGDAVDAEHHGFAADDELPMPVLQRGLDDPRQATGPVVAAARNEPREGSPSRDCGLKSDPGAMLSTVLQIKRTGWRRD